MRCKSLNKRKEKLFWVITLVLCVLLFIKRVTGEVLHSVLGLVLLIMVVVHVYRQIAKLNHRKVSIRCVDWILMVALAVVIVTGVLLHPLQGMLVLKILHKLSAVIFVIGVIAHMVQHKESIRR